MTNEELHYEGSPIVPEDSFLRRMPSIVAPTQRLLTDAIVLSGDILTSAFSNLKGLAGESGQAPSLGPFQRMRALGAAWTIVDQLHASRQLIRQLATEGEPGPFTTSFYDLSDQTRVLRNKMDHLAGNITNITNKKGRRSPLFGSISYFYYDQQTPTVGYSICIAAGALHDPQSIRAVNPLGRRFIPPADLFEFTAFGQTFPIGPPLEALRRLLKATTENIEGSIRSQLPKLAAEHGLKSEDLMAAPANGLTIAMRMEFETPLQPFRAVKPGVP